MFLKLFNAAQCFSFFCGKSAHLSHESLTTSDATQVLHDGKYGGSGVNYLRILSNVDKLDCLRTYAWFQGR